MRQKRVVKIVPTEFINEARDLREISVLVDMGCEVTVVAKETTTLQQEFPFSVVRLSSRPLSTLTKNATLNRIASIYTWQKTIRTLHPEILSCHDILCLLIGWISNLFNSQKAKLVYDSHEFEYARNVKRTCLVKFIIKQLERFLIKKAELTIVVNDTIASAVQKLHNLPDMPTVVRNIPSYWNLDMSKIKERKDSFKLNYGIKEDEALVLYQGAVAQGRGIEKSIETMKYLSQARLVILGGG